MENFDYIHCFNLLKYFLVISFYTAWRREENDVSGNVQIMFKINSKLSYFVRKE